MKIGLIIAIERELKSFLESGTDFTEEIVSKKTIYKSLINGHQVYAIKSGCGIIDASAATQLLISKYDCEMIVNFGVTGALEEHMKVEDLFIVRNALNYQYDVSPIDNVVENQYEEFENQYIPLDGEMIDFVKEIIPEIKEVTVASGDRFIEEQEEKISLRNKGCNICDMEIAAIARISYLCGVKCLSIKCISDTFEGDGGDFQQNVESSAKKAFDVILKILNRL